MLNGVIKLLVIALLLMVLAIGSYGIMFMDAYMTYLGILP